MVFVRGLKKGEKKVSKKVTILASKTVLIMLLKKEKNVVKRSKFLVFILACYATFLGIIYIMS